MFENRRFSYQEQVAYRLVHELCHKLCYTTFQRDPEFLEILQKTFISRDETGTGFSGLGSTFHYENQGSEVQGREDLVEMTAMLINEPDYLKRFLRFLVSDNPENEAIRQSLKLKKIEPETAQRIYGAISQGVAKGLNGQLPNE